MGVAVRRHKMVATVQSAQVTASRSVHQCRDKGEARLAASQGESHQTKRRPDRQI
jgi:hypothetical protein